MGGEWVRWRGRIEGRKCIGWWAVGRIYSHNGIAWEEGRYDIGQVRQTLGGWFRWRGRIEGT